mmetsp:Transcript_98840/g.221440  ORF Transcript_98840/g.221440 Transcript_98840/m.221440 type:complete len:244 (-) Transcript_98840:220-951(-)
MALADSTLSAEPDTVTSQLPSSAFLTFTSQPHCFLTSLILLPPVPMMLPMTAASKYMTSVFSAPLDWPPPDTRSWIICFALATCSALPEIFTVTRSSPLSMATCAPLLPLTSLIFAPPGPTMHPKDDKSRSIDSVSRFSRRWSRSFQSLSPQLPRRPQSLLSQPPPRSHFLLPQSQSSFFSSSTGCATLTMCFLASSTCSPLPTMCTSIWSSVGLIQTSAPCCLISLIVAPCAPKMLLRWLRG